jgi:hypothetical protein
MAVLNEQVVKDDAGDAFLPTTVHFKYFNPAMKTLLFQKA